MISAKQLSILKKKTEFCPPFSLQVIHLFYIHRGWKHLPRALSIKLKAVDF